MTYEDATGMRKEAEGDLAESLTLSIGKALRMLGATIGTDADAEELSKVAVYAEAVLVAIGGLPEYATDEMCANCLATGLTSDAELGCSECRLPMEKNPVTGITRLKTPVECCGRPSGGHSFCCPRPHAG